MKNLSIIFATAFLALLSASCTSGGDECGGDNPPSTSSGSQNNAGDFEMSGQVINGETQKPYTGSGKIYMADKHDSRGNLILTEETMLLVGTMDNGKITFNLPENVDSRFLRKMEGDIPAGMEFSPLGVEILFYADAFRLIDDSGNHIGNVMYGKLGSDENHIISYCYFSQDGKINGILHDGEGMTVKYEINAKKGWNNFYMQFDEDSFVLATTDLSKAPKGLGWIIGEVSHGDLLDGTNYEVSEKEDCNGTEYNPKIQFCSAGVIKDKGEFEDKRDGKKYKTVVIENQTWMAENLNYEIAGSRCYDNKPANCEKCGKMYNWFTATTKEICPEGWRLPNNDDWKALDKAGGGKLKARNGQESCSWAGYSCTDDYGFSALACGSALYFGDMYSFKSIGISGYFWSSTESDWEDRAYDYMVGSLNFDGDKYELLSVRCIKNGL
jgi:uncharacterized protein (TIGR02145 family)